MAEINELLTTTYTLKAGEDAVSQHCVVSLDATCEGRVVNPSGAGAGLIAGVLRDTTLAAGAAGTFQIAGIAKVMAAEAVAVGDMLIVADSQGRVKPQGEGPHVDGTGIVGRAISPAATAGSLVKCILCIPAEFCS